MVSPLQDLSNRIASNTLTATQQTLLTGALAKIIPGFPEPDEISNSIVDESQARTWIAPLFTLNAIAGGSAVLPTQEVAWYINASTGSDTNNGTTPSTPLKTVAALANLWRGVSGGGRPVLTPATGSTVTVTLQSDIPATDPLAPILDVDLSSTGANPVSLIIKGSAKTAAHSGTMATASAFARTSAGGQPKITDAGVADFAPFVGVASLLVDSTSGAVGWLYGPDSGASATGTLSVGYNAQTPGLAPSQAQTNYVGADAYTLADVTHASLGQGFVTRSFPQLSSNVSGQNASVFFYRLHLVQPSNNDVVNLASDTVIYCFQECQNDHQIIADEGTILFANCFSFHNLGLVSRGSAIIEYVAGGVLSGEVNGTITAIAGGTILADQDFAVTSQASYQAADDGVLELGRIGFWVQAGGNAALECWGAVVRFTPIEEASTVFYGTDGGTPIETIASISGSASIIYFNDGSGTPAGNQFKFTNSTFQTGDLTSSFGFDASAGTFEGPTTNTFAHLDAALAAGTGFGGQSIDPSTGSYIRIGT